MRRITYLLRQLLAYATFGKRVYVHGPYSIGNRRNVTIGELCSINRGVYIQGYSRVAIGNRVTLSANCMLLDSGLRIGGRRQHTEGQIVINDDVWIGAGAIVLQNVELGEGCVIGAGSVVTRSVPSYCVYAGNPARLIRRLDEDDVPQQAKECMLRGPEN